MQNDQQSKKDEYEPSRIIEEEEENDSIEGKWIKYYSNLTKNNL